jgi:PmbA protein
MGKQAINYEEFASDTIKAALKAGADEADVFIQAGRESEVSSRMARIENLKKAISQGFGLRVFKNKKLGFCHSSDFSGKAMRTAVEQAIALANEVSADEYNGLAEVPKFDKPADLQLFDGEIASIPTEDKINICLRMEETAFAFDKRITNSEGAGFSDGDTFTLIADSNGNSHSYKSSYCYIGISPVATEDGKLQSGSWLSAKRFYRELDSPENIAKIAAERTVRMLGAKIPNTISAPVVFDNLMGSALLGNIIGALDGEAVYKGASFLADKLEQVVASTLITLVDDALMPRGLASSPIDGEGLPTQRKEIVSRGTLNMFLYDSYMARKAKVQSTGNARREYNSLPSVGPFNFYLENGTSSPDDIIGSVKNGLYLTSLMGFGANIVTGDYSLGASGLWIENGKLSYPVEGITVAANMLDILKRIDMVGNDLIFLGPMASPTFRVSEMTISGA